MIFYNAGRNPPLRPSSEFRIFNNDMGLGIVGCMCHMVRDRMTVAHIQETVSAHFNIAAYEMRSARRDRHIVRPRQIAMLLSKELTPQSLPDIGRRFGDRDHTTVIHAIRTIRRLCLTDPVLAGDVAALRARLSTDKKEPVGERFPEEKTTEQGVNIQVESLAA